MLVEVKNLPKSEIQITVEVPANLLEQYENDAAKRVSESVSIPGYRPGQAPKAFVIAQIGADAFFQEVLNIALPKSYFEAIKEKNLQVISRPDIKILSKSPLKYEARVAVMPEIIVKGVEKFSIPEEEVKVSDEEIANVVEEMRRYRATYKPRENEVQQGDRIEIDFEGFDEKGVSLDKTKSTNHPLFIGEGSLVPGFEEQLIGMKTGEKKKFPVKFPKDFHHAPLKSKTVHFEVHLKRAEETILPILDEAFVESVMGEKKKVEEFKEALRTDLHNRKRIEGRKTRENRLLEKLLEQAKFDTPPVLIEEEVDYMILDIKKEVEARGITFETYVKKLEEEKRDLKKDLSPEAEKRVRIRLVLNFLFRTLGITATDEELLKAGAKLLEITPENEQKRISENLAKKGDIYLRLKNNLLLEKLFVHFLDKK